MGKSINMGYFFSNLDKLRSFSGAFELQAKQELLKDLQLGLTNKKSDATAKVDS